MQPSEKYKVKEKFDVSTFRFVFSSNFSPCIFQVVASLPTKVLLLLALPKNATDSSYYLHQIVINCRWRRCTPFSKEEVFILNWFSSAATPISLKNREV
jgi:hypothetical protein